MSRALHSATKAAMPGSIYCNSATDLTNVGTSSMRTFILVVGNRARWRSNFCVWTPRSISVRILRALYHLRDTELLKIDILALEQLLPSLLATQMKIMSPFSTRALLVGSIRNFINDIDRLSISFMKFLILPTRRALVLQAFWQESGNQWALLRRVTQKNRAKRGFWLRRQPQFFEN